MQSLLNSTFGRVAGNDSGATIHQEEQNDSRLQGCDAPDDLRLPGLVVMGHLRSAGFCRTESGNTDPKCGAPVRPTPHSPH